MVKLPRNWLASRANVQTATFESRCGWCDEPIHEGDKINKVDDEWVHAECVEEET
jgi:hypothetical protein